MAWEENPRICLHMQLIAILSRTGVTFNVFVFGRQHNTNHASPGQHLQEKTPAKRRLCVRKMVNICHTGG